MFFFFFFPENSENGPRGVDVTGNKGEWSEVYIFLKLLVDGRVYAADKDMQKIPTAFLNILKIIREEIRGMCYWYVPGQDVARVMLNGSDTGETCSNKTLTDCKNYLWQELNKKHGGKGAFAVPSVYEFIKTLHLKALKSPAQGAKKLYGGTVDITMEVEDPRSSLDQIIGFSCKSDFAASATLFNAGHENTSFEYVVEGNVTDGLMDVFNDTWVINKDGSFRLTKKGKKQIATANRIKLLKEAGCSLRFLHACSCTAVTNLTMAGGMEMPSVVGEMVRYFYFDNNGSRVHGSIVDSLKNLIDVNPANYKFAPSDIEATYRKKVKDLLYEVFTGMRLGTRWNGTHTVTGGYIVVKDDGDVLAYHTCLEDEFKDFLATNLGLDAPSGGRHGCMQMYKVGDEYRIKLGLQIRFYRHRKNSKKDRLKQ